MITSIPDLCPFPTLQDTFTQCIADSIDDLCISLGCDTKNLPSVRLVIRLVGQKVGHKVGQKLGWSVDREVGM